MENFKFKKLSIAEAVIGTIVGIYTIYWVAYGILTLIQEKFY